MAYIPPFEGGRISLSISGNTSGTAALVTGGILTLAGGNNVTLSQSTNSNGAAITINGASANAFSAGISAGIGNTSGTSGFATNRLILAGGNNVTLSQSTNSNGNTLTISAASQSNQALGINVLGNTTVSSASITPDARSLSFSGMGAASIGLSGSAVQVSVPVQSYTASFTAGTANTTSNSSGTFDVRSMRMQAYGNITAGINAGTILLSGSQSAQSLGLYAVGNTLFGTFGTTATADARSLSVSAQGGLSGGFVGNTVILAAPTASNVVATGIVSVSSSGNSVSIGAPAFSAGMSNIGNTTGTSGTFSNQLILAGGNNITLSQATDTNGATVSIAAASQSIQTQGIQTISIGFNTAGTNSVFTGPSLGLAGGANITLSQFGNAIAVVGNDPTPPGIQAVYDGSSSYSTGTLRFFNQNGISFGFSTVGAGAQRITASHNGITSQSIQTQGLQAIAIGLNTAGTSALISSGTLTMLGGGNITLSQINASQFGIVGNAPMFAGVSNFGNTAGTTGSNSANILLIGGNNITLSQGLNTLAGVNVTLNAAGPLLAGISTNGNTSGVSGLVSNQLVLAGDNNVTLNQSTNSNGATLSISAGAMQLNDGTTFVSSGSIRLFNQNGISFGLTTATGGGGQVRLTASHNGITLQTVQTQGVQTINIGGNTTGTTASISSGALSLYGGNNITLSQNANSLTISGASGGGGAGGVAVVAGGATYSSGSLSLSANGALTIASSTAGQGLNLSVPSVSSLSATGALSISTNGAVISIGVPAPVTLSRWEAPVAGFTSLNSVTQMGVMSLQHLYIPFNVTAASMKVGGSLSVNTTASATTGSINLSLWMGIYSLNGSTLSLMSNGSANNGFVVSNSNSSTANTSLNGMRQLTVPMNINITPGEYWVGAIMSTATNYASNNMTYVAYGANQIIPAASNAILMPIGAGTASARDVFLFQGIYNAAVQSSGPATLAGSVISNAGASNVMAANYYNAMFNATY